MSKLDNWKAAMKIITDEQSRSVYLISQVENTSSYSECDDMEEATHFIKSATNRPDNIYPLSELPDNYIVCSWKELDARTKKCMDAHSADVKRWEQEERSMRMSHATANKPFDM